MCHNEVQPYQMHPFLFKHVFCNAAFIVQKLTSQATQTTYTRFLKSIQCIKRDIKKIRDNNLPKVYRKLYALEDIVKQSAAESW